MNWFHGLVPTIRPDETVAEGILATVAAMRKDGSFNEGASLCWSPAELETLAMFAIGAKHELSRLRSERVTLARLVFPVYDPSGLDAYNAIQLARQVLTEEETGR